MNNAKKYIQRKKTEATGLPKSPSARTFLHLENRTTKNLAKSQGPVNLVSSFPYLERNFDGQGRKFSSTTIVNGSASSRDKVHPSCAYERVVVLPVETIVPDILSTDDAIFTIDPGVMNVGETSLVADIPENGYFTVQEQIPFQENPHAIKLSRPPPQKLVVPAVGNCNYGKRGRVRFGKSRMIADTQTSIPVAEYKAQLNDTMDIVGKMELAPPTKRMMHLLNTKGVNKLFALPGRQMGSKTSNLFVRHLTLKQTPVDTIYDDMPLLPVGFVPEIDKSKIKRITRKRKYPEAEEYQRNLQKRQLEYLESMQTETVDPEQCTVFMHPDEIINDGQDDIVYLGSMDTAEVAIHEEEVLDDILYQECMEDEIEVVQESEAESSISNDPTIIVVNGREVPDQSLEDVLAEAEKRGIRRDEIQKVIIYQPNDGKITPSFNSNEKFIIMSCDPSETEIVIS